MSLGWWEVPRKGWMIIFSQFTIILFLSSWLYVEYLNNPFMRQYLAGVAPTLLPILTVTFGMVAAMSATTLYIRARRSRSELQELTSRSQSTVHRTPRKKTVSSRSTMVKSNAELPGGIPSPTFLITESKASESKAVEQKPEPSPTPAQQLAQPAQASTPTQTPVPASAETSQSTATASSPATADPAQSQGTPAAQPATSPAREVKQGQ